MAAADAPNPNQERVTVRDRCRAWAREHPRTVTSALSAVGYALVLWVFLGDAPLPPLSDATTLLFGDLIAVLNAAALCSLWVGVWCIRRRAVRAHRAAMLTAFGLILLFLVFYLWKVGGGFEKAIIIEGHHVLGRYAAIIRPIYLAMLAIHVFLSAAAVPVVLHAVVLGLTHEPSDLTETLHPTVGRIAVAVWSLSLALGLIAYLLLNHVYAWTPRAVG